MTNPHTDDRNQPCVRCPRDWERWIDGQPYCEDHADEYLEQLARRRQDEGVDHD